MRVNVKIIRHEPGPGGSWTNYRRAATIETFDSMQDFLVKLATGQLGAPERMITHEGRIFQQKLSGWCEEKHEYCHRVRQDGTVDPITCQEHMEQW